MSANGDTLEHLSTWLRTESPTHAPAGVNRMMDLVAAEVADAPVAVERIPGRAGLGDVLVLRAGPQTSEPAVLVMSHLDTVHPLGTADHDLPVRLEGDRLYGPGCYDMKGGAYLALEAFKAVARSGGARRPLGAERPPRQRRRISPWRHACPARTAASGPGLARLTDRPNTVTRSRHQPWAPRSCDRGAQGSGPKTGRRGRCSGVL